MSSSIEGTPTIKSNAEVLMAAMKWHPDLDDDQLSRQAGIKPRQQVNQIGRRLEGLGLLRRELGPNGKIVNVLIESARYS